MGKIRLYFLRVSSDLSVQQLFLDAYELIKDLSYEEEYKKIKSYVRLALGNSLHRSFDLDYHPIVIKP